MTAVARLGRWLARWRHRDTSGWWLATIAAVGPDGCERVLLSLTISARLWPDPALASRVMLDRYVGDGVLAGELVCHIEATRAPRR